MSNERILIVEDESLAAMNLEEKLLELGYRSAGIAFTAEEAIATAEKERPDLVLMDIQLRGMPDGTAAAQIIHDRFDIPVIFVTAFSDDQTIEKAKKTHPFGYLMKPYRDHSIKTTIEIALNAYRLEKRLEESEKNFRSLFDLAPVAMVEVDTEDRILRANDAMARLFQRPSSTELKDRKLEDLLEPGTWEGGNAAQEFRVVLPRGRIVWLKGESRKIQDTSTSLDIRLHIYSDITAQKAFETVLSDRAQSLSDSNEQLQHFTSIASHDMKAPARTANHYAALLAREYGDRLDDRGQEYLGTILSESKRMQEVVEDLLEYSSVSYSKPEMKVISLVKVARDVLAILAPEITEKRADISFDLLPEVVGSEVQLRRLFMNIVDNALKYSRRKPKIHIAASTEGDHFVISFSDNGIGIDEADTKKVFEIFQRGHSQSQFPGTGIGLASCKKVMENHGGTIWVDSRLGKGSTFFLSFPTRPLGPSRECSFTPSCSVRTSDPV
ncbi:MAG: response regulator [Deltaproteobacteria bacterium]|nr:response regulator [Deltaproteobacteria bacterium]MBI3294171.1 response regulator [Deltaproteobacteria bacterium]